MALCDVIPQLLLHCTPNAHPRPRATENDLDTTRRREAEAGTGAGIMARWCVSVVEEDREG